MPLHPLLLVELPVPIGREDEWNRWYRELHMPDAVAHVPGIVASSRYHVVSGVENDIRYVVAHRFESVELLEEYVSSSAVAGRFDQYIAMWGAPLTFRRRALVPEFEVSATPTDAAGVLYRRDDARPSAKSRGDAPEQARERWSG